MKNSDSENEGQRDRRNVADHNKGAQKATIKEDKKEIKDKKVDVKEVDKSKHNSDEKNRHQRNQITTAQQPLNLSLTNFRKR